MLSQHYLGYQLIESSNPVRLPLVMLVITMLLQNCWIACLSTADIFHNSSKVAVIPTRPAPSLISQNSDIGLPWFQNGISIIQ